MSWYFVAQVVVQIAAFFSVIMIARYLGPINLGLYSFVQNYVGAFLAVVGGMDFYFIWKIAKSEHRLAEVREYIGHKIDIYIIFSIIGIALAWTVLPGDLAFMVTIMLAPIFLQSLNVFSLYAVATSRAKLMAGVQIFSATALLFLKLSLVLVKAPLYLFIAVSTIELVLSGIILAFYFLRDPEWKKTFASFKLPFFLDSFAFFYSIRVSILALIFFQLLLRIDQLILATISNAYTLGIYSAAVKIAEVPNFLAAILSTALVSRVAQISAQGDAESKEKIRRIMLAYLIVGCVIAVGVILLAPIIVHILYGAKFVDSVSVLRAYAVSIPAMFMNYFFLSMYGAGNRYLYQASVFSVCLAANIILIYLLTPLYGLVGTAFATALAYTIAALSFYLKMEIRK